MSNSPYVQFYTSDFLGGTSGMTAASKGVYITLLCLMYETEAPLTQKWDMLARRCGCTLPAFKKAVSDLADDGKITITDDGLWSEKCEKHIALRRERQNSAASAAKKRWEKSKQKQEADDAGAMQAQCQPEPEPELYKYIGHFEEFWSVYPHRNGRKQKRKPSLQKFEAAVRRGVDPQQIIDGARAFRQDRKALSNFAPDPSTWLNQEGWTDEIDTGPPDQPQNERQAKILRWNKIAQGGN